MKRGLKGGNKWECLVPDPVALITPMKRGLKVSGLTTTCSPWNCCTNYPDEKGTESVIIYLGTATGLSCTNYPDEKGTESVVGEAEQLAHF